MDRTLCFPPLFYKQRLNAAGIFLLVGVLLYLVFPKGYALVLIPLALGFLFSALILTGERRKVFLCFAAGLCLALVSTSLCEIRKDCVSSFCESEVMAEGYVVGVEKDSFDVSLILLDGKPRFFRVRCQGEAPRVGSKISAKLLIEEAYPESARSEGIALSASLVDDARLCGKSYLFTLVGNLRDKIMDSFGKGETGSFLSAILLGERSGLSKSVKEAFRITASSHILAISGLHVTQLLGFFFCLSRIFSFDIRFTRSFLYPLTLLLYLMAGAGVSVFRAVVMTLFATTGILLRRRSDSVTALVFSAVLLVFPDPYALENMSFVFSYFSTFALVCCGSKLAEDLERSFAEKEKGSAILSKTAVFFLASFAISSAVFVFMLPLQLLFFGEVQIFSPLYALILVPLFQPVLILALFLAVISFFPGLYSFLSPFLLWIPKGYLALVKLMSAASPDLISLGKFALPGAGISALVLLFFFIRKAPLSRIYYFHLFSFAFLCICLLFA